LAQENATDKATYTAPVSLHLKKKMLSIGRRPHFVVYPQKLWTTLWTIKKPRRSRSRMHRGSLLWSKNNQPLLPSANNELGALLGIALALQVRVTRHEVRLSGPCE
jgi:hypothetical protein